MARSVDFGKEVVWRKRLRRFERSDLTVVAFCRSEGVSAPSFYHWRKRLAERDRPGVRASARPTESFVPVRLSAALTAAQATPAMEIHLPNGTRICLPGGDRTALRIGIAAAGALPGPAIAAAAAEAARC